MTLIDTHCHFSGLSDIDIESLIKFASAHSVDRLIVIGSGDGFEENTHALSVANKYSNVYCTLGFHPHEAKDMTEDQFFLLSGLIADNAKVVGIGETGLDYHYMHSPKNSQQAVFACFVALAGTVKKPLVVHDRDCGDECVDIIKNAGISDLKGVVHCFSGNLDLARKYLDLGFMISFTGIITFPKAQELRDVLKYVPLDRIMLETDAPFLTPHPHRGKKNQPAYVKYVAERMAEIKQISFEEVSRLTTQNAELFFGLGDVVD
ncbi:MAG: YabD [uncultured bacterium]|nr:MAG: YabD [uncultured bacterium]